MKSCSICGKPKEILISGIDSEHDSEMGEVYYIDVCIDCMRDEHLKLCLNCNTFYDTNNFVNNVCYHCYFIEKYEY